MVDVRESIDTPVDYWETILTPNPFHVAQSRIRNLKQDVRVCVRWECTVMEHLILWFLLCELWKNESRKKKMYWKLLKALNEFERCKIKWKAWIDVFWWRLTTTCLFVSACLWSLNFCTLFFFVYSWNINHCMFFELSPCTDDPLMTILLRLHCQQSIHSSITIYVFRKNCPILFITKLWIEHFYQKQEKVRHNI